MGANLRKELTVYAPSLVAAFFVSKLIAIPARWQANSSYLRRPLLTGTMALRSYRRGEGALDGDRWLAPPGRRVEFGQRFQPTGARSAGRWSGYDAGGATSRDWFRSSAQHAGWLPQFVYRSKPLSVLAVFDLRNLTLHTRRTESAHTRSDSLLSALRGTSHRQT